MALADPETRARLYNEYVALDDEYRKLGEKLKPFELTAENRQDTIAFFELGTRLEEKLHELQEASNPKRVARRPGSGF